MSLQNLSTHSSFPFLSLLLKVWLSLVNWATLSFLDGVDPANNTNDQQKLRRALSGDSADRKNSSPTASAASAASSLGSHQSRSLPPCHRERVKRFLRGARAAYGRTALCLSGGAMMGNYHWGHVKALLEEDCLPHIISGTSAGAVIGAFVCCRTDEEIARDMKSEILSKRLTCFSRPWVERFKSVLKNGHLFSQLEWLDLIDW